MLKRGIRFSLGNSPRPFRVRVDRTGPTATALAIEDTLRCLSGTYFASLCILYSDNEIVVTRDRFSELVNVMGVLEWFGC